MNARTIPLLSLFSAFSFVVMMFNLPLPGGTTGHAVGMGVASIVLGPWVGMLAISVALLIQALFFGDGGITALGANCFNMAIVGSLVAYAIYRVAASGAAITSGRRVFAAGLAGYTAINVSALFAAIEFGIQPMLFRDATGAPLYAPYPLHVAIPAMMIGHLTFAGLAELLLTAGLVQYLQKVDPAMLHATASDAPLEDAKAAENRSAWKTYRTLWIGLALAVLLTPFGVVAVGSAWGEWRAQDFADPAARQQIQAASRNQPVAAHAPIGLERLQSFWKAPVANYAPVFIRNVKGGYLVSAVMGVLLIVAVPFSIHRFLFAAEDGSEESSGRPPEFEPRGRLRKSYLESTLRALLKLLAKALFAEDLAAAKGLLQALDPRVKLAGFAALIICAIAVHRIWALLALFGVAALLAAASRISLRLLGTRVWLPVLFFTGLIALPALFSVPGDALLRVPLIPWPVTAQGLTSAVLLILRAATAATLALLLVLSTPWNRLLRALRLLFFPATAIVIVATSYRFVFLLLQTALSMFESRQVRFVGYLAPRQQRRLVAATVGVLLDKSLQFSGDVHVAMQARGFRGDPVLLDDLQMRPADWLQLAAFLLFSGIILWLGR